MKVISTIALLAIFALTSLSTFAQDTKTTEKGKFSKVDNQKVEKGAVSDALPYLDYKGIKNQDEAKQAWIADHPKEYATMQGEKLPPYYNYNGIADLDKAKEAWVKDHPEEYKASQKKASKK